MSTRKWQWGVADVTLPPYVKKNRYYCIWFYSFGFSLTNLWKNYGWSNNFMFIVKYVMVLEKGLFLQIENDLDKDLNQSTQRFDF